MSDFKKGTSICSSTIITYVYLRQKIGKATSSTNIIDMFKNSKIENNHGFIHDCILGLTTYDILFMHAEYYYLNQSVFDEYDKQFKKLSLTTS